MPAERGGRRSQGSRRMDGAASCPGGRLMRYRSRSRGCAQPTSPSSCRLPLFPPMVDARSLPSIPPPLYTSGSCPEMTSERNSKEGAASAPSDRRPSFPPPSTYKFFRASTGLIPVERPVRRPLHTWTTAPNDAPMGDRMR
jgi:hypothetical protein